METNDNKEYQKFRLKTSIILDVFVLCFIIITFSIFGLGIPFGVVFASALASFKRRLDGGNERTFNLFMEFSLKHVGKATLIWIMLFPILIILCISFYIATQMGEMGLYIVIVDLLAILAFITYCFYVFYEFVCDPKEKKMKIIKAAFYKMKTNISNTLLHMGILVGVAGTAIFVPYYVLKFGIIYILITILMVISSVSMREVK